MLKRSNVVTKGDFYEHANGSDALAGTASSFK